MYNGNDAHSTAIYFSKSRGTSDGANTVVQDDDQIGSLFFQGADGSDKVSRAATIAAFVDGTPGSDDMPGRLTFLTTADGAASPSERMRISSTGRIWIGADSGYGPSGDADDLIVGSRTNGSNYGITILSHTSQSGALHFADTSHDSAAVIKYDHNVGSMYFATETSTALTITSSQNATFAGTVSDSKGNLRSIIQNSTTGSYTLVVADAGKHVLATGTVTIPNSTFAAGDAVTIINNSGSDITLTASVGTLYNTADASTGNRTLAGRGMATILFSSATVAYISGAGLS